VTAGAKIAERIAKGLARAGQRTGTGPLICTIRREGEGGPQTPSEVGIVPDAVPQLFPVTAIEDMQDVRDMTGMLIGVKKRTLTINATSVAPLKSDRIAVGVVPDAVTEQTVFEEILAVTPLSPAGTALLYELSLAV
jgi:hypothetical protein